MRYLLQDPIMAYNPMVNTMVAPGAPLPWPKSVRVPAVPLISATTEKVPHLWGLTLRMTQEILGMELSPYSVMSAEKIQKYEPSKL
jgi:hypothetical protein